MFSLFRIQIWCLLCAVSSHAWSAEPIQLRVLSYNIHHAQGIDGQLNLERIAEVINSVHPDLVALQEVDQNVRRSRDIDQPAELARLTQMHVAFGANIDLQGGHYGNAVLSRFPIVRHQNHLLPNIDNSEQRGVLETEPSLADQAQTLILLATHLDFRRDPRERLASAKQINRLAEICPHAMLLAGDMNATPASPTLREFGRVWQQVSTTPNPTVPVGRPIKQIDYIMFRPVERWSVVEVRVLEEAIASDHRPILAVVELLPGE